MLVDALGVFLPNDPDGNAKLVFSILDCLPKANRVSGNVKYIINIKTMLLAAPYAPPTPILKPP